MIRRLLLFSILALLVMVESAWGAYYIDADATDDTGAGTEADPWKTIAKVEASAAANDTVYFQRGDTWYEQLDPPGDGMTFGAYGSGNLPRIHGGTLVTSWTDDLDGTYSKASIAACGIFWEDNVAILEASAAALADGNWFYDAGGTTLHYKPTSGVPTDHTTHRQSRAASIQLQDVDSISISDIEVRCALFGVRALPTNGGNPFTSISITGCTAYMCSRGLDFKARNGDNNSGIILTTNDILNCGTSIFVGSFGSSTEKSTCTITGNSITDGGITTGSEKWEDITALDQEGIGLQNNNNSTISQNTLTNGCSEGGIVHWVNAASGGDDNTVSGNLIDNIDYHGITLGTAVAADIATGNVIANNRCCDITGSGHAGIRVGFDEDPSCMVYNNVASGCDISYYIYTSGDNWNFRNNISLSPVTYHFKTDVVIGSNTTDYNDYYPDTGTKFRYNGTDYNFTDWKTQTSQDANSITGDPLLVDVANENFHLQADSPCRDTGYDTSGTISLDFAKAKRKYGSAVDMGAHEYIPKRRWWRRW